MTISETREFLLKGLLKDGFTRRIAKPTEEEVTKTSRVYFAKDLAAQRDREIIEEVIQEIITNRGVSREEAEGILNNPL